MRPHEALDGKSLAEVYVVDRVIAARLDRIDATWTGKTSAKASKLTGPLTRKEEAKRPAA